MLKAYLHGRIRRLERAFGYDATYLHEVLDVSTVAFLKFGLFQVMSSHRRGVPGEAWSAARLAATLNEDCGPCAQLTIDMALAGGMQAAAIAALLRGDLDAAGADAALGFRYGAAVAANAPEAAELAGQAEARFGRRGLVSLSYAVASARVYPALKRGLGHGATCTRLRVVADIVTLRPAA